MPTQVKRPRVLIINCYADRHRQSTGSPNFVPQSSAPIALAGSLHREKASVKVYSEFYSGPSDQFHLFSWANMLVLTGLNTSFDRMRQITAYARTLSPFITVVIGGSIARVLPKLCNEFSDYVCDGDAEQLSEIIDDRFGRGFSAEEPLPRFDLMDHSALNIGYVESTRNCNFNCNFCSMTAEEKPFTVLDEAFVRKQLDAIGYRRAVIFVDQNFYGGPRSSFWSRMDIIQQYYSEGKFGGWGALLTEDFFLQDENIEAAKKSGCIGFYCGVESFSSSQIMAFNKKQNLLLPQEQVITRCLEAGMVFNYGLVFDPSERSVRSMEEELDYIVSNPKITLPSFISVAIPMIGTPLFYQRLKASELLPNMKLLDMDGRGLCTRPRDNEDKVVALAARLDRNPLPKRKLLKHAFGFYRNYRRYMGCWPMLSSLMNTISMGMPYIGTNFREGKVPANVRPRTYHSSTETIGSLYDPQIKVQAKFEHYFKPLYITDEKGELNEQLMDDLSPPNESSDEYSRNLRSENTA